MGIWRVRAGYRYSPSTDPPTSQPPPGTPPHARGGYPVTAGMVQRAIKVRGAHIGSSTHFRCPILRVLGFTEGYNLATVGNPNDQKYIPSFK